MVLFIINFYVNVYKIIRIKINIRNSLIETYRIIVDIAHNKYNITKIFN